MATDDREQQQRPETPEQRRRREAAAARAEQYERHAEERRILAALRSNDHLWEFAEQTAEIVLSARDTGGGSGSDPTGLPLSNPQLALCDRVNLCRRVNELVAEGVGYVVIPQYGPPLKEDAR